MTDPVHVQIRADAALGAAWRRCEKALPKGWFAVEIIGGRGEYLANAYATDADANELAAELASAGRTPADALNALADALEAR